MPLSRFTNQQELAAVYKTYCTTYASLGHDIAPWPAFNNFQVLKSTDNVGVYYTPEATLFSGSDEERRNQSFVAKNIGYRLLDCAAYFLAQNIPVEDVPAKLRVCLAVCHNNTHWTGVIATTDSFQEAYKALYEAWGKQNAGSHAQDILHNNAKNAILGIIFQPNAIPVDENVINKEIVAFFQKDRPLVVDLYDSMNSDYYEARVYQSLHNIDSLAEIYRYPCSQQKGNTCGDHTTINLFAAGIMNSLPVINGEDATITSADLREITDTANINKVKRVLDSIPVSIQPLPQESTAAEEDDILIKKCNQIASSVYSLINAFNDLNPEATPAMVQLAICKATDHLTPEEEGHIYFLSNQAQKEIFDNLVALFTGFEDSIPYAGLARLVANDYIAEIEHLQILGEQERVAKSVTEHDEASNTCTLEEDIKIIVDPLDFTGYEAVFTQLKEEILNKIRAFEDSKHATNKRHPWQLGWGGSQSQIICNRVDYYVPKTIYDIYNKITDYEQTTSKWSFSERERYYRAHTTFNEISQILEANVDSRSGMLHSVFSFFKELVATVFGYKRSDETRAEYATMKTMISGSGLS